MNRSICLWIAAASLLSIAAWQGTAPLSLVVEVMPGGASTGETLSYRFVVTNTGDSPLAGVVVRVNLPEGIELLGTEVPDAWSVTEPPDPTIGEIVYRGQGEIAPGGRVELVLRGVVLKEPGQTIRLDDYSATADGMSSPVQGTPVIVWVARLDTPVPSPTSTARPTATATVVPSPSPTVTPLPTPTRQVVIVEPSPTPNLSSEQERIGTVTVSVFVGIVVVMIVLSVSWVLRSARGSPPDAGDPQG